MRRPRFPLERFAALGRLLAVALVAVEPVACTFSRGGLSIGDGAGLVDAPRPLVETGGGSCVESGTVPRCTLDGKRLVRCAGTTLSVESCGLGCAAMAGSSPAHCKVALFHNGLRSDSGLFALETVAIDVRAAVTATLDTDRDELSWTGTSIALTRQSATSAGVVYLVSTFVLETGATLTVKGSEPAILAATGDVTLAGILSLDAVGGAPGPGGGQGGLPAASGAGRGSAEIAEGGLTGDENSIAAEFSGGGGGGGVAIGGEGGSDLTASPPLTGGAGGKALAMEDGLVGGGGGGGGQPALGDGGAGTIGGAGGGGGGTLQIVSLSRIVIEGTAYLSARGAAATPGSMGGAGGGGGGGGVLLLEAPALTIMGGAVLDASGGFGGQGGMGGNGGSAGGDTMLAGGTGGAAQAAGGGGGSAGIVGLHASQLMDTGASLTPTLAPGLDTAPLVVE